MRRGLTALRVDQIVAALAFAAAEAEVWLGGDASFFARAGSAVVVGIATGSIAVRRSHPAAVGIGVQGALVLAELLSLSTAPVGPPFAAVGWFCALYALAVWTTPRWFWFGLAFFVVSDLLPGLAHAHVNGNVATFTL